MDEAAVLDASALIALIKGEPGADLVHELLPRATISAVNWIEVIEVIAGLGVSTAERRTQVSELGISLAPLTPAQAESAAALRPSTRSAGLSVADRACLALALELDLPAMTADRAWADLDVGVEVKLIR
jgi:PIN domain nuclease of toxin-antitoxin system